VATYIPQVCDSVALVVCVVCVTCLLITNHDYVSIACYKLARVNPDLFAVSVYTVDSQVWSYGDTEHTFTVQSCSKPVTYAISETLLGVDKIRKHVGHEPSGKKFNVCIANWCSSMYGRQAGRQALWRLVLMQLRHHRP
jgi:glutaminase